MYAPYQDREDGTQRMNLLNPSVSLFAGFRWKTSGSSNPARSVFMKRTAEHTILVARTSWLLYSVLGSGLKDMKGLKFSTTESRADRYISDHGPEMKVSRPVALVIVWIWHAQPQVYKCQERLHLRCSLCAYFLYPGLLAPHAAVSPHHSGNPVQVSLLFWGHTKEDFSKILSVNIVY